MAHILLKTLVFAPDGVSTAVLMAELALELKQLGHDLTVITTTPHYNKDREALSAQPLTPVWGNILYESRYHGIRVLHVRVGDEKGGILRRLWSYLRFHLMGLLTGVVLVKAPDVIIAPSPPLTIGFFAWLIALLKGIPFAYNVQEIYPDIAVKLGVLQNKTLIRMIEQLERFVYARSERIIVISDSFKRALKIKQVPSAKIAVIPNFVDTTFIRPVARQNVFSRQNGLDGRFVILYAGNIGLTQNFKMVLEAAERLAHIREICFLIVGDGALRPHLMQMSAGRENVKLLPYQPRGKVPALYGTSDLCLVPLKNEMGQDTFPSKIYTIMAAGKPVIVSADPDSELCRITEQSGCGWGVPPDNTDALVALIQSLYQDPAECGRRGKKGREYVMAYHAKSRVARQYHGLIEDMVR